MIAYPFAVCNIAAAVYYDETQTEHFDTIHSRHAYTCIIIIRYIHYYAYSLTCIFITMHIHCHSYSLLCIFIIMHSHYYAYHYYAYSFTYIFTSLCIFTSWQRPILYKLLPKLFEEQTQTDTHSYAATSIRLQKILQDRVMIIRVYRLSGWFYNKLCECQLVCRCYLSHWQAVLYETILWQLQVVL